MAVENIIKLKRMRDQVKQELDGIPRGDFDQNMLRQAYWALRTHDVGIKENAQVSKEETFVRAAKIVQKDNPNFRPNFKEGVFDSSALCSAAKKEPGADSGYFCSIKRKGK